MTCNCVIFTPTFVEGLADWRCASPRWSRWTPTSLLKSTTARPCSTPQFKSRCCRCTSGPTPGRNHSSVASAGNSSASYATISIIAPSTRAPGSSRPRVPSAASTSTTAGTSVRTWRYTGTGRNTDANSAARASTRGWPTTCTWGSIQVSTSLLVQSIEIREANFKPSLTIEQFSFLHLRKTCAKTWNMPDTVSSLE